MMETKVIDILSPLYQGQLRVIERFSFECHKTKTKTDWTKKWRDFFKPITWRENQTQNQLLFNTQMKTTLTAVNSLLTSKDCLRRLS